MWRFGGGMPSSLRGCFRIVTKQAGGLNGSIFITTKDAKGAKGGKTVFITAKNAKRREKGRACLSCVFAPFAVH
jgi:hypothetical protein